jgi:hypothetical protein
VVTWIVWATGAAAPTWYANDRVAGVAVRVGEFVALTVSETVVMWLRLPDVPVTVTVEVPAAAVLLADSVMTPLANEAVTPAGRPEAVNATVPPNPFTGVTVIVLVPLAPGARVNELGEAERLKSGAAAGLIVRPTAVVWLSCRMFRLWLG